MGDRKTMGIRPPGHEERRWIEAAVRRMFRALSPLALETVAKAFREWKLPPETIIVKQGSSIDSGPGLCILFKVWLMLYIGKRVALKMRKCARTTGLVNAFVNWNSSMTRQRPRVVAGRHIGRRSLLVQL